MNIKQWRLRPRGTTFLISFFITSLLHSAALNQPAPSFALVDLQQHQRSLSSYRGKVLLINFWASWCGPCQQELPALSRLGSEYQDKKVRILAINVDENWSEAQKLLTRLGISTSRLEILRDSKSKVVSAYQIEAMPSSFIIDAQGIIRFSHSGFHAQDPGTWRQELDTLLRQTPR